MDDPENKKGATPAAPIIIDAPAQYQELVHRQARAECTLVLQR